MRCDPAQVALAWLLAQGDDIAPTPAPSASTALVSSTSSAATFSSTRCLTTGICQDECRELTPLTHLLAQHGGSDDGDR
jgi:hypothetical protein